METDHIFVFSKNHGKEADSLVDFGFTEGSSRLHPGQGTTNRKFYFDNFFIEILWVVNKEEIKSKVTSETKLWERSQFMKNESSPFGLCLVNLSITDSLFEKSRIYQPNYFPKGMHIDIITNEKNPRLPWTFRLPYQGKKITHNEPTEHSNGIKSLTCAKFEINTDIRQMKFTDYFKNTENIVFEESNRLHLTLEFDNKAQHKTKEFPKLSLTLKY